MGKQKMTEEEMRRKNKGRDKVRWGPFSRLSGHGNCFSIYLRSGYDIVDPAKCEGHTWHLLITLIYQARKYFKVIVCLVTNFCASLLGLGLQSNVRPALFIQKPNGRNVCWIDPLSQK